MKYRKQNTSHKKNVPMHMHSRKKNPKWLWREKKNIPFGSPSIPLFRDAKKKIQKPSKKKRNLKIQNTNFYFVTHVVGISGKKVTEIKPVWGRSTANKIKSVFRILVSNISCEGCRFSRQNDNGELFENNNSKYSNVHCKVITSEHKQLTLTFKQIWSCNFILFYSI